MHAMETSQKQTFYILLDTQSLVAASEFVFKYTQLKVCFTLSDSDMSEILHIAHFPGNRKPIF